jgi:hypothetical protein
VDAQQLLDHVLALVWPVLADAADRLADPLATLEPVPDLPEPLAGRLLGPVALPQGGALLSLLRQVVGELDQGGPLRWHGWQGSPDAARGIALVVTEGDQRAVLALSPGPVVELAVVAGTNLGTSTSFADTELRVSVGTGPAWQASWSPGQAAVAATGTATVTLTRSKAVSLGASPGPGVTWSSLSAGLRVTPTNAAFWDIHLADFSASILPDEIASLLGDGSRSTTPVPLGIAADAADGLRFADGSLRLPLPGGIDLPGLTVHGLAVVLEANDRGIVLRPTLSMTASLPALPLTLAIDGVDLPIPVSIQGGRLGVLTSEVLAPLPDGIGVDLSLPPVTGGGVVKRTGEASYGGLLDLDLGVAHVQAMALVRLPRGGNDLSVLVLMSATFPPPGIQVGFGFALDGIGGLVGINRRVDVDRVRDLVSDGNADRVMFPENAIKRADEIIGSLVVCFPAANGHHLVGPMLQLSWGGRLVRVSVAVLLELPDPVRVILLGRMLIGIPDPAVPLIRLQASVFGRVDPGVPLVEVLVSLAGSYIGAIPVTGEIYALFRGGASPVFILSAGGFHPRYTRPPGVPALRRLSMDLGGGFLGLRGEAYLALTSNSLQFGAMIQLDATIAGCGVEGHLGLDALFVWEPVLAFSVQVQAGVAVLAFGERLASVALRFTLEGPGAWHAFGTGSISILWWDVDLDFDVRWGTPPALTPEPPDLVNELKTVCGRAETWTLAQPVSSRIPLRLTPAAHQDVVAGRVALPDAVLRLSQQVVPLDVRIERFHRISVPAQTWRISRTKLGPDEAAPHTSPVLADFVPGEFETLSDDDQMGRAAFEKHRSGTELTDATVRPGTSHDVDDTYETAYEVEEGWFPAVPPARHTPLRMSTVFALEGYARHLAGHERVHRWQLEQRRFVAAAPMVVLR